MARRMRPILFIIIFLVVGLSQCFLGVEGSPRYCHKCISIDCHVDYDECQEIRSFVKSELKDFYYYAGSMDLCPKWNKTDDWNEMKHHDEPCPQDPSNHDSCTLGRLRVKTVITSATGRLPTITYTYGTVMGCPTPHLINLLETAFKKIQCDYSQGEKVTSCNNMHRQLDLEHCPYPLTWCNSSDYCTDTKRSAVEPWIPQKHPDADEQLFLTVGILVLIGAAVGIVFYFAFFTKPWVDTTKPEKK